MGKVPAQLWKATREQRSSAPSISADFYASRMKILRNSGGLSIRPDVSVLDLTESYSTRTLPTSVVLVVLRSSMLTQNG